MKNEICHAGNAFEVFNNERKVATLCHGRKCRKHRSRIQRIQCMRDPVPLKEVYSEGGRRRSNSQLLQPAHYDLDVK